MEIDLRIKWQDLLKSQMLKLLKISYIKELIYGIQACLYLEQMLALQDCDAKIS